MALLNLPENSVTNEQYRALRGTDRPFTNDPLRIRRAWYRMNRAAIDERRRREKKFGRRCRRRNEDEYQNCQDD